MEIYWDKIIESHIVKAFRKITPDWWGIDVHFYDKSSNCKNTGISFLNPLCSLIQSKLETAKECYLFRVENLKESNKSPKTFVCKYFKKLRTIVVPIIIDGDNFGAIMCSGMQFPVNKDQKEEIIKRLVRLGFDKMVVEQRYNKINTSTIQTEDHVLHFMKLIAEDIAVFYKTMNKKEGAARKQAFDIDRYYTEKYNNVIGKSPAMKKVFNRLELIEDSESPVLIEGESGTGKEMLAAAIHYNSPRKEKPFIIQNCSFFNDALTNSEFFGHEKGSFTNAVSEKKGIFELADGGTLFLDEIGEMSISIQSRFLRVLENGTFYRVGGTKEKVVDIRIITATNSNMVKQVEEGLFRRDLFYRINAFRINLRPLRERKEDILPLFYYFLRKQFESKNMEIKNISPEINKLLLKYNWPGNIRELKNTVESLIILSSKSKTIELEHLPIELIKPDYLESFTRDFNGDMKLPDILKSIEKKITEKALQRAKWNKTTASRALGISRSSLNDRIKKFQLIY
jgi:transcriptional regulator with PAS, ATPase and Fis domain